MIARHRDELLGAPTRSFKQKTTKPRSGSTVNHYLCALSIAFKFGIRDLGWCESNPVAQVRKPPASRWRTRFLSDVERDRLLDAARVHVHLYAALVLSLSTGLRQGELYRLTWNDIDCEARWAVLPFTKNGDVRGIPLTKAALSALDSLPHAGDAVFPFDLTKAWRSALRRAQITNFRWHDLRHSAASHLASNGASAVEIATLLGHRTLGMVRRYAHLANHHTRSLVDRVMGAVQ
jgi:integrase